MLFFHDRMEESALSAGMRFASTMRQQALDRKASWDRKWAQSTFVIGMG
jgi:hypothetical protein